MRRSDKGMPRCSSTSWKSVSNSASGTTSVSKHKVVSSMKWPLEVIALVMVLQWDGRRLVPEFYHLIRMFGLKQKRKFDLGTLSLNDTAHRLSEVIGSSVSYQ